MKRIYLVLAVLLWFGAGCDSSGPDRDDELRQDVTVRARTTTFDLREDASFDGRFASVQYEFGLLSPSVVDEGAVLTYFKEAGTWTAMPYTISFESDEIAAVDYSVTFAYAYDDDLLEIFYEASNEVAYDDGNIEELPGWDEPVPVKIVVIEGFPVSRSEVDVRDYEAVKRYFNLEEQPHGTDTLPD